MNIRNKRFFIAFSLFSLLSFAMTAHSFEIITMRYIHNYSKQPWSLSFSMDYGAIASDLGSKASFKDRLQMKIEPGQSLAIYYESTCGAVDNSYCSIKGKLVISDFENRSHCYQIATGPYLTHHGVTGPVVLNDDQPYLWSYGTVKFIGDSWRSWAENNKNLSASFGSTCMTEG